MGGMNKEGKGGQEQIVTFVQNKRRLLDWEGLSG